MSSRENTTGAQTRQGKSKKTQQRLRAATPRKKATKPAPAATPATNWIVVHGGVVQFESAECGPALQYIRSHRLPADSLYRSSNVAAMVAEVRPPDPQEQEPSDVARALANRKEARKPWMYRLLRKRGEKHVARSAESMTLDEAQVVAEECDWDISTDSGFTELPEVALPKGAASVLKQMRFRSPTMSEQTVYFVTSGEMFFFATSNETDAEQYVKTFNQLRNPRSSPAVVNRFEINPHAQSIPAYVVRSPFGAILTITESKSKAEMYHTTYNEFHKGQKRATLDETTVLVPVM